MKTKKTPYNPHQLEYSFSSAVIKPDGSFNSGHTVYFKDAEKMRIALSDKLKNCRNFMEHIDNGEVVFLIFNKTYKQLNLSEIKLDDYKKVLALCSSLQLTGAEINLVLLIFKCMVEEKLAISRGITEKQLQELLSKIYEKMGVNSVFQIKFVVDKFVSLHQKTLE